MRLSLLLVSLSLTLALPQFAAAEANSARNLAAACNACHAPHAGSAREIVSLYGADKSEMIRKMQEFRSGARPFTLMQQIARGYSEQQTTEIAGWFAAQPAARRP